MTTVLDLTIFDTHNCKTLGIWDTSQYLQGQVLSSPIIKVGIPGFFNEVTLNFVPKKINILNSNDLGLSTVTEADDLISLPDGVYCITYCLGVSASGAPICGETKQFLRTCRLQCRYDNALLKLDILSCDDVERKQKINKLQEIDFFIQTALAAANVCNFTLAMKLYNRAQRELDKLNITKCS
jgi:hypothetical protein